MVKYNEVKKKRDNYIRIIPTKSPWKFSDSIVVQKAELTKELFQYQMDRVSNDRFV